MGSIIFGRLADDDARQQADDHRKRDAHPIVELQRIENNEGQHSDQHGTNVDAETQRTEQLLHIGPFFSPHQKDAYHRKENSHRSDQHRGEHGFELHIPGESCRPERRRGEDRAAIAFIEVGAHAGHVAHIVAHVIGDGRRIARIVFGNTRFDFTYQVGAHIGRFRVNSAADTREQRLRRGTHTESQHRRGNDHQFLGIGHPFNKMIQDQIPYGNIEQAQPHHDEPHHGAAAKSHPQAAVKGLSCRMGGTGRSICCGTHPDVPGQTREKAAGQEGERHPVVLHPEAVSQEGKVKR